MRSSVWLVASLLAGSMLPACGSEAGRISFTGPGSAAATFPLQKGQVTFWTALDAEWQGDASLGYAIELDQAGKAIGAATCNPLGLIPVKSSWTETNLGGSHSRHGVGKMTCTASVPAAGPTTVKATLAFAHQPATFTLTRADLVIKQ